MYVNIRQPLRKLDPVGEFRLNDEFARLIYHSPIRASRFCCKSQPFRKPPNTSKSWSDNHAPSSVNKSPFVVDSNSGKLLVKFAPNLKLRRDHNISRAIDVSKLAFYLH